MNKHQDIINLKHYSTELPWSGQVIVLNDGGIITSEDKAMIQALHSRDPKGIFSHLEKLAEKGSGKMMESFYVGYGHKSIGDCGTMTIFIENVSMLAAKAIQDSQLYNGQECSTRYIDFSKQDFLNGVTLATLPNILTENLRNFYIKAFPMMVDFLKSKYQKLEEENEIVYDKAIKARVFDILRGFLPAGATTNLAWTGTLRQVADRLQYLRNHPLEEIRIIANKIQETAALANPFSFGHTIFENTENYNKNYMNNYYYLDNNLDSLEKNINVSDNVRLEFDGIDKNHLKIFQKIISERPIKTELPKSIAICGQSRFSFLLDFGSFRDIQRHRSIIQRMPLLTTKYGFENWYLENLSPELKTEALEILSHFEKEIKVMKDVGDFQKQYFIPMGYKVPIVFSGDLSALTYITEIRATKFVHPTLQIKAVQLGEILEKEYGIKIYINKEDIGRFDSKRGLQDIVEKK